MPGGSANTATTTRPQWIIWLAALLLGQAFSGTHAASSGLDGASSMAQQPQQPEVLALPAPEGEGAGTISLDVSTGDKVSLDHLGPVVVTLTGQLRRITNWAEMTEREQSITRRRITKRNRERLATLRAAQATETADVAPDVAPPASGGAGDEAAAEHREL